jgi:hypothetical protein
MNISNISAVAKLQSCKKDAKYAWSSSDNIIWSFAAIQDFLNYCSIFFKKHKHMKQEDENHEHFCTVTKLQSCEKPAHMPVQAQTT